VYRAIKMCLIPSRFTVEEFLRDSLNHSRSSQAPALVKDHELLFQSEIAAPGSLS
jgi:hypothetical protein